MKIRRGSNGDTNVHFDFRNFIMTETVTPKKTLILPTISKKNSSDLNKDLSGIKHYQRVNNKRLLFKAQ